MRNFIFFTVILMMCVTGCRGSIPNGSFNNEEVKALANFSLIDSNELSEYVENKTDEAFILKMVLDYNLLNDDTEFYNNVQSINNAELKKKMLVLSNNFK